MQRVAGENIGEHTVLRQTTESKSFCQVAGPGEG